MQYENVPKTANAAEVSFTDPDETEMGNSEQLEGETAIRDKKVDGGVERKKRERERKKSSQQELKEEGKYKN